MKKLSILMALVLMLVAIVPAAVTPATAADTPTTSMDEALIAHFDFTKLSITSNDTKKLLRPVDASCHGDHENLYHEGTTIENGVATMTAGSSASMKMNLYTDFAECTNGMTAFIAVNLASTHSNMTSLYAAGTKGGSVFRFYEQNGDIVMQHGFTTNKLTYEDVPTNQWVWIAGSFEGDASSAVMKLYVSVDEGTTWTVQTSNAFTPNVHKDHGVFLPERISVLTFGKGLSDSSKSEVKYDIKYDDVKIWNRALTAAEVESITVEESTPYNIVAQTRTESEDSNTFDIRFSQAIDKNALAYTALSYEISIKNSEGAEVKKAFELPVTAVYKAVLANGEPVTAEELGGDYISAIAITGIPKDLGELTFEVTPKYECGEGRVLREATFTFTYSAQ